MTASLYLCWCAVHHSCNLVACHNLKGHSTLFNGTAIMLSFPSELAAKCCDSIRRMLSLNFSHCCADSIWSQHFEQAAVAASRYEQPPKSSVDELCSEQLLQVQQLRKCQSSCWTFCAPVIECVPLGQNSGSYSGFTLLTVIVKVSRPFGAPQAMSITLASHQC